MHRLDSFLHDCPISLRYAGIHDGCSDFPLHHHDMWEVIYQRAGHVKTRQGGALFTMSPGMIIVHSPGVDHADIYSAHYELIYLHFDATHAPQWPRLCHDDRRQSISRVCEALYREFQGVDNGSDRMRLLLTAELDILLQRAREEQELTSGQRLVAEAMQLMEERYRLKITMGALAAEIGVSRSSLYSHFCQLRGQSPPDYLLGVRLRHALGLLHHSPMTLEAIADRSGFHSASHLSRHIKAATGASPGALRKAFEREVAVCSE
ncbi:MAG: AraC family transcriptional regulator [Capsulimonas sp.]|uniref:AraC family transcriptional regulator n=1 Tax=Capsulimonas sp. TaxID=2494211 RepID=UPI0032638F9E